MTTGRRRPRFLHRQREQLRPRRMTRTNCPRVGSTLAWGLWAIMGLVLALRLLAAPASAQSAGDTSQPGHVASPEETPLHHKVVPGTRRALIVCGHPGDQPHRQMYARSVAKLHAALTIRYGFPAEQVWVLFGSRPQAEDAAAISAGRGLSTSEAVQASVAELRGCIRPADTLWVIVIGHAHFDGRHSFLNLPGPDVRDDRFGKLFAGIESRRQVFFITTPASGFFIKHLSAKGRIVITATEADLEVNETVYHAALADVLSSPPQPGQFDVNRDGRLTVLDLYLTVARRVVQMYQAKKNIPTEHAQLDDNGDGRGSELQMDYLEPELGGRAKPGVRPKIRPSADGALAATATIPRWMIPSLAPMPGTIILPGVVPLPGIVPAPKFDIQTQ